MVTKTSPPFGTTALRADESTIYAGVNVPAAPFYEEFRLPTSKSGVRPGPVLPTGLLPRLATQRANLSGINYIPNFTVPRVGGKTLTE